MSALPDPDDGISVGAQHGTPNGGPPAGMENGTGSTRPQLEVGGAEDSFAVYKGGVDNDKPTDGAPGWRWVRENGLHAHGGG